jgi:hypothetical protein
MSLRNLSSSQRNSPESAGKPERQNPESSIRIGQHGENRITRQYVTINVCLLEEGIVLSHMETSNMIEKMRAAMAPAGPNRLVHR